MTAYEKRSITEVLRPLQGKSPGAVESTTDDYLRHFEPMKDRPDGEDSDTEASRRRQNAVSLTDAYYDLATDFYEYGWGESFHFAVLRPGESREHSFAKQEYYLAMKLSLQAGDTVLVSETSYLGYHRLYGVYIQIYFIGRGIFNVLENLLASTMLLKIYCVRYVANLTETQQRKQVIKSYIIEVGYT